MSRLNTNIIIAGVGGQGVVTAGTIISDAASNAGLKVVMSEIHGLAQRGGSVTVDVRIGNVESPMVPKGEADLILGFEEIETVRSLERGNRDTFVIMNLERLPPVSLGIRRREYPDEQEMERKTAGIANVHRIDANRIGREAGNSKASGTAIIGAALSLGRLPFALSDVETALRNQFSGKVLEVNLLALSKGFESIPGKEPTPANR